MNLNIMIICKCDVRYRIFIPDLTLILVPVSLDYNTVQCNIFECPQAIGHFKAIL